MPSTPLRNLLLSVETNPSATQTPILIKKQAMALACSRSRTWAIRAASYMRLSISRRFSSVVKDLKHSNSHEWAKVNDNLATVGVTDHAQDHLGDVIFVKLPEVGINVSQGCSFGAMESIKSTSDINSPISGKVIEVNEELNGSPGLINASPYEKGWIVKVEMSNPEDLHNLMDSEKYSKFCAEEDGGH